MAFSVSFQAPSLILYTGFLVLPMFVTLYYALLQWNGISDPKFIGFDNFSYLLFEDRYFVTVLLNTVKSMLAGVFIQLPIALVLAYMVYRTVRGFHFFQSVYFVPVVISAAIIGLMFSLFFNPDFGPINAFLVGIGREGWIRNWLSDPNTVLFSVIFPGIWQYVGYYFVIFLAAMQSIPGELIESSLIDGANTVQIFFRIVLPNILDIIQVCVVICCTGAIKTFDIPYIMTQGGPGVQSSFLSIYMYKEAFINSNMGMGTALATVMLIMAICATIVVNGVFRFISRDSQDGG